MDLYKNKFYVRISADKLLDAAKEVVTTLQQEDPDTVKFHAHTAHVYLETGNYIKAVEELDAIIDDSPNCYYARLGRGILYILSNRLVSALGDLDFILDYAPEDELALYYRGYIYLSAGSYDEALDNFNEINHKYEELFYLHLYRCICYYNLREFTKALSGINLFLKMVDDKPEYHLLRGFIYLELSQYEKCIKEMDYVLRYDEQNEDALYTRFVAHRILGLNTEANEDISTLLNDKLYFLGNEETDFDLYDELLQPMEDKTMLN